MDISTIFIHVFSTLSEQEFLVHILIFFIAVILLKLVFKIGKRLFGQSVYQYKPIGFLFSKAEYTFYLILQKALSDHYDIFAKVRIADVPSPANNLDQKNKLLAFNKISSKHFDYVLCVKNSPSIVAVIELDDRSHSQPRVKERDAFVNKICETANLNLVRFKCAANYDVQDIRQIILNSMSN